MNIGGSHLACMLVAEEDRERIVGGDEGADEEIKKTKQETNELYSITKPLGFTLKK